MASAINAGLCALVAAAFYSTLGYAIARPLLPRMLVLGAAPVIGWAVFSASSLPILRLIGFSPLTVIGLAALSLLFAGLSLPRPSLSSPPPIGGNLWWLAAATVVAAILAIAPAIALLPKYSESGVHLAAPIFDHSKIAIIDAMTRQGLPPVSPVFAEAGATGHLVYYYLWHFSAAELALPLHVSGWEADIGLTWFTAFASLTLMMGLAIWLSRRAGAALLVVALAASASLREALFLSFGNYGLEPFLQRPSGFAGWLFQSAWVPQHLMSASCTITAMLLLVFCASWGERTRTSAHNSSYVVILALVVAAGFESSAFVGGVTFALAALAATPLLWSAIEAKRRATAILGLALAGALALGLAAPFIRDQFAFIAARGSPGAIGIHPFEVLGDMFPETLRRVLDLPAYWLILLPLEFPASFIAGVIAMIAMLGARASVPEWITVKLLGVLAAAGLAISWLLVSRLGDNNDLALRAVLPAVMILIVFAAAGALAAPQRRLRAAIAAFALGGLVLSLPDSAVMIYANWRGSAAADEGAFARTPELWNAVRRHAPVGARVANNPLFLQDLTPWPANMSWALHADRSSCFAGRELAIPFAALSPERRDAINDQFIRVFAGAALTSDVGDLATKYGCDVVVVVPQDGAWTNDPFAVSKDYRLAETRDDRWRIYVRAR
jgi:hypothetical protein